MASVYGRIKVLTDKEMQLLHNGAVSILQRTGMKIYSATAREYLLKAGCKVDNDSLIVRFPDEVTENAVQRMKQGFTKPERNGVRQAIRFTEAHYYKRPDKFYTDFTVNAGGFNAVVLKLDGERRYAAMEDVHNSIKLVNALDQINYSGLPCADQDTPHQLRPVKMAAELVKYTTKIGGVEAWNTDDIKYLHEIGVVVRGSEQELRRRPCLVGYGESRSPLALDSGMAEIFIEYLRNGMPQSLDTMPAAGTTSPATGAATLALGLSETIAGLVLGYAVADDAVLSIDFTGGYNDMGSLIFPYAGADRMPLLGGWVQILREFYGITAGVHGGKTNSCYPGIQAGMEKAQSILFPVLCGASGIGTVGQVEFGITYSPLQLMLDAEIVRATKRILQGFEVNEDTLCLDLIDNVGPEGNFITEAHTADNFQREFWLSGLTQCIGWETYTDGQRKGMEDSAEEQARDIIAQPLEPVLNDEQIEEIDRIVAHAAKKIGAD